MKALCIGNVAYDFTMPMENFPKENLKYRVENAISCGGGPASNAAYLLSLWGVNTYFAGVIGNDDNGKKIKEEFKKVNVNTRYLEVDKENDTAMSFVLINQKNGSRTIFTKRSNKMKITKEINIKPDLILVDGGELQVSVVKEVIDSLNLDIAIVGLKKNEHHRTSTLINSNLEEISIKKDSSLFVFLSKIQEEVHRYAITYHRNIKSKGSLSSILDMVDGVGPARKKQLLKKFGSLKKMREASIEELETILPGAVAKNLFDYLKNIEN